MWPVLANQLGSRRVAQQQAQKRLDKSSAVSNGRLATQLDLADKNQDFRGSMSPPWAPQQKLDFKGGWLKRIAARNNMQKFFLRAQ